MALNINKYLNNVKEMGLKYLNYVKWLRWCYLSERGSLLAYEYKNLILLYPFLIYLLQGVYVRWDNLQAILSGLLNTSLDIRLWHMCVWVLAIVVIFSVIHIIAIHGKFAKLLNASLIFHQACLFTYIATYILITYKLMVIAIVTYKDIDELGKLMNENSLKIIWSVTHELFEGIPTFFRTLLNIVLACIFIGGLLSIPILMLKQIYIILMAKNVTQKEVSEPVVARFFCLRRTLLIEKTIQLVFFRLPALLFLLALFLNGKPNSEQPYLIRTSMYYFIATCVVVDSIFQLVLIIACHKKTVKLFKASLACHQVLLILYVIIMCIVCKEGYELYTDNDQRPIFYHIRSWLQIKRNELRCIILLALLNLAAYVVFLQVFVILSINEILRKTQDGNSKVLEDNTNSKFDIKVISK